jgi:trehalose 6-phosphate synthase
LNLVAKEFVAAQDENDPGVLILSRFAGAMHELDAALLVNPYDTEMTAAAIARALQMPIAERRQRWRALMARLLANGVDDWCSIFLKALRGVQPLAQDDAERLRDPASRSRVAHASS